MNCKKVDLKNLNLNNLNEKSFRDGKSANEMSFLQWESAGLRPGDLWVEGEDLTQGLYQPRTQIPLPQALQ